MKEEESQLVCQSTLESWDHLTHLLATASEEVLSYFVFGPVAWGSRQEGDSGARARDAVPVYLDHSAGKVLAPYSALPLTARQRQGQGQEL
eukprot:6508150-Alexandrium_andersonii.AAC.1